MSLCFSDILTSAGDHISGFYSGIGSRLRLTEDRPCQARHNSAFCGFSRCRLSETAGRRRSRRSGGSAIASDREGVAYAVSALYVRRSKPE